MTPQQIFDAIQLLSDFMLEALLTILAFLGSLATEHVFVAYIVVALCLLMLFTALTLNSNESFTYLYVTMSMNIIGAALWPITLIFFVSIFDKIDEFGEKMHRNGR